MAFVVYDRVLETSTTTGTGTVTLAGAVSGYQAFSVIGNGNNTYYAIVNRTGTEWETGVGTYTSSGTTLSRDTVISSSNSNSLVNFSAGTKDVFCSVPAIRTMGVTIDSTVTYPLSLTNPSGGVQAVVPQTVMYAHSASYALTSTSSAQNLIPSGLTIFANYQYQFFSNIAFIFPICNLKQIYIKGNVAGVAYEIIMNRESN